MATRDASRTGPVDDRTWLARFGGLSRYDLVLLAIPLAFALGTALAATLGQPLDVGIRAGGVLAVVTTGYALFGASPTDDLPGSGSAR